jgi:hypothetical protein
LARAESLSSENASDSDSLLAIIATDPSLRQRSSASQSAAGCPWYTPALLVVVTDRHNWNSRSRLRNSFSASLKQVWPDTNGPPVEYDLGCTRMDCPLTLPSQNVFWKRRVADPRSGRRPHSLSNQDLVQGNPLRHLHWFWAKRAVVQYFLNFSILGSFSLYTLCTQVWRGRKKSSRFDQRSFVHGDCRSSAELRVDKDIKRCWDPFFQFSILR